jgi:hypothetical protein
MLHETFMTVAPLPYPTLPFISPSYPHNMQFKDPVVLGCSGDSMCNWFADVSKGGAFETSETAYPTTRRVLLGLYQTPTNALIYC